MTIRDATDRLDPHIADAAATAVETQLNTRLFPMLRLLCRVVGRKILGMFIATIPIGMMLGAVEVANAFVLYLVLSKFHLIAFAGQPAWLPNLDPIVLLAMSTVITALLRYLGQVIPNMANTNFERRMRQALARVTLESPGEEGGLSVADASHLLTTSTVKTGNFLQFLMTSVGIVSLLALIVAELVHLSWQLTAISLAGAAIFAIPVLVLKPIYGRYTDRAYSFHRAFVYRFLKDVRNAQFLKVCGLNRIEVAQLNQTASTALRNNHRYALLYSISNSVPALVAAILIVGLLWLNERYAMMPVVSLIPFIYLLNRMSGSFVALSTGTGQIRELLPYAGELARRADQLFPKALPRTHSGNAMPSLSVLEVRNLGFGRQHPLTRPLSFSVRQGEMALISGPSGRGKTTLLMTLLGLVPPLAGQVTWDAVDIETIDATELRKRVGFAGPEPYLIDADIRTNLLFGLGRHDLTEAEIDRALHVACADFVKDLRGGIAFELRENGDGISAGQKQRLALARCILRRPDVLFLDEATANIDEDTEKLFFERLSQAYPKLMIIAVSHRSSLRNFATDFIEI